MSVSKYSYTEHTPSPTVYEHINMINSLSSKTVIDLAAICMERDIKSCLNKQLIEAIALKNGYEPSKMEKLCMTLATILNGCTAKLLSEDQIKQDLSQLGMEKEMVDTLTKLLKSKRTDDVTTLFTGGNINQLVNLEWKFGVTAASSELDRVGTTFLQLKLTVLNSQGSLEDIHMELSLSQFYNFLHELEKAKARLESIS